MTDQLQLQPTPLEGAARKGDKLEVVKTASTVALQNCQSEVNDARMKGSTIAAGADCKPVQPSSQTLDFSPPASDKSQKIVKTGAGEYHLTKDSSGYVVDQFDPNRSVLGFKADMDYATKKSDGVVRAQVVVGADGKEQVVLVENQQRTAAQPAPAEVAPQAVPQASSEQTPQTAPATVAQPLEAAPPAAPTRTVDAAPEQAPVNEAQAWIQKAQESLIDRNTTSESKIKALEWLAANGVTQLQLPDADGRVRNYTIEQEAAGSRKMVHLWGTGDDGQRHIVLRGIMNQSGEISQERSKQGPLVRLEGDYWSANMAERSLILPGRADEVPQPRVEQPDPRAQRDPRDADQPRTRVELDDPRYGSDRTRGRVRLDLSDPRYGALSEQPQYIERPTAPAPIVLHGRFSFNGADDDVPRYASPAPQPQYYDAPPTRPRSYVTAPPVDQTTYYGEGRRPYSVEPTPPTYRALPDPRYHYSRQPEIRYAPAQPSYAPAQPAYPPSYREQVDPRTMARPRYEEQQQPYQLSRPMDPRFLPSDSPQQIPPRYQRFAPADGPYGAYTRRPQVEGPAMYPQQVNPQDRYLYATPQGMNPQDRYLYAQPGRRPYDAPNQQYGRYTSGADLMLRPVQDPMVLRQVPNATYIGELGKIRYLENGRWIVRDQEPLWLPRPAAEAFVMANRMLAQYGKRVQLVSDHNAAGRTHAQQMSAARFASIAARPGNSNHENPRRGAIDIANWQDPTVRAALQRSGFSWGDSAGPIRGDYGHFSFRRNG